MSNSAITAAWQADVQPAARKLVLLFMADCLNDKTGQLNPSMAAIARACGMSQQQARRHLRELIEAGHVQVIGNHNGGAPTATRNYRLALEWETPVTSDTPITDDTPTTDDRDPYHPRPGPLSPMTVTPITDGSQTRKNQNEPEGNQKIERAKRAATIGRPDGVDESVWSDFLAIRKAKRAPLTATALSGIEREAKDAGITLQAALACCCERGWQSFKAAWYANAAGNQSAPGKARNAGTPRAPAREGFDSINYGESGLL